MTDIKLEKRTISFSPSEIPEVEMHLGLDGWVFNRSGYDVNNGTGNASIGKPME